MTTLHVMRLVAVGEILSLDTQTVTEDRWSWAGRHLAAIGSVALAAGILFKLAAMNIPMAAIVVGVVMARLPFWRTPGFWPAVLLVCWGVISIGLTHGVSAIDGLGYLYVPIAFGLVVCGIQARPWALTGCLWSLAIGGFLHLTLGLVQFVVGTDPDAPLQVSQAGERYELAPGFCVGNVGPSIYAATVVMALVAGRGLGLPRWLDWSGRAAGLAMVALNQSRGVVAALCATLVCWRIDRVRGAAIRVAIAVVLILIGSVVLYQRDTKKFKRMLAGDDHRFAMWTFAVGEIGERPLLGHGGQKPFREGLEARWQARMGEHYMDPNMKYNLHNTPLNYMVFNGVPAGLLHLWFLFAIGWVCWRSGRMGGNAFGVWVFVFTCGLFDATFSSQKGAYTMCLLLALVLVADRRRRERFAAPEPVTQEAPAGGLPPPAER